VATESLTRAFESTRAVLAGIAPGQLELPTPCQSWNVAKVINHMNAAARFGASAVATGEGVPDEQDFAGGDVLVMYDQTAAIALEAFGADGVLEKVATMPFGPIPGGALMMIIAGDQFTHGWDLARATGHSTDLDPELAAEFLAFSQQMVQPEMRGPDGKAPFGPECDAPDGACPADTLAAFLGRSA
jgi:uncharacterized protein (TIGR03086 family)